MFCIECGRILAENSKFCRYCGTRQPLEEDSYIPPETIGRPVPAEEEAVVEEVVEAPAAVAEEVVEVPAPVEEVIEAPAPVEEVIEAPAPVEEEVIEAPAAVEEVIEAPTAVAEEVIEAPAPVEEEVIEVSVPFEEEAVEETIPARPMKSAERKPIFVNAPERKPIVIEAPLVPPIVDAIPSSVEVPKEHKAILRLDSGREIELVHKHYSLGRVVGNDIIFDNPAVSRKHAAFEFDDGEWFIIDSGSTNGVKVNGERLDKGEKCSLMDGDVIVIAKQVKLLFSQPEQRAMLKPETEPAAKSGQSGAEPKPILKTELMPEPESLFKTNLMPEPEPEPLFKTNLMPEPEPEPLFKTNLMPEPVKEIKPEPKAEPVRTPVSAAKPEPEPELVYLNTDRPVYKKEENNLASLYSDLKPSGQRWADPVFNDGEATGILSDGPAFDDHEATGILSDVPAFDDHEATGILSDGPAFDDHEATGILSDGPAFDDGEATGILSSKSSFIDDGEATGILSTKSSFFDDGEATGILTPNEHKSSDPEATGLLNDFGGDRKGGDVRFVVNNNYSAQPKPAGGQVLHADGLNEKPVLRQNPAMNTQPQEIDGTVCVSHPMGGFPGGTPVTGSIPKQGGIPATGTIPTPVNVPNPTPVNVPNPVQPAVPYPPDGKPRMDPAPASGGMNAPRFVCDTRFTCAGQNYSNGRVEIVGDHVSLSAVSETGRTQSVRRFLIKDIIAYNDSYFLGRGKLKIDLRMDSIVIQGEKELLGQIMAILNRAKGVGRPGMPMPARPGAPAQPGAPMRPGAPAQPGAPMRPGAPVQPGTPMRPGAPVQPGAPMQPGAPVQPAAPAGAALRPGEVPKYACKRCGAKYGGWYDVCPNCGNRNTVLPIK